MKRAPESTVFALAAMLLVAGCAAAHPATEDSEPEAVTTSDTLVGTFTSADVTRHPICAAGTSRECKTYWTDNHGQLHCFLLAQVCRNDGFSWTECGDNDGGAPLASPDSGAASAGSTAASTGADDTDAGTTPVR